MDYIIFYHVAVMKNWKYVHKRIVDALKKYGVETKVIYCVSGNIIEFSEFHKNCSGSNNAILLSNDVSKFEFPTINFLQNYAYETNTKIFYIHTKGASTEINPCIDDWVDVMLHFLFSNVNHSIKLLNSKSAIGVDLSDVNGLHFSGNFWGTSPKHVQKLPEIPYNSERHSAEKWICSIKGNYFELHSTGINPLERHLHRYPKENY
jgi:hypothetical protein